MDLTSYADMLLLAVNAVIKSLTGVESVMIIMWIDKDKFSIKGKSGMVILLTSKCLLTTTVTSL